MTIRTVIITGPGFQDEEVIYPYYRMLEEGYKVDIAVKDGAVVRGKYGVPAVCARDAAPCFRYL